MIFDGRCVNALYPRSFITHKSVMTQQIDQKTPMIRLQGCNRAAFFLQASTDCTMVFEVDRHFFLKVWHGWLFLHDNLEKPQSWPFLFFFSGVILHFWGRKTHNCPFLFFIFRASVKVEVAGGFCCCCKIKIRKKACSDFFHVSMKNKQSFMPIFQKKMLTNFFFFPLLLLFLLFSCVWSNEPKNPFFLLL